MFTYFRLRSRHTVRTLGFLGQAGTDQLLGTARSAPRPFRARPSFGKLTRLPLLRRALVFDNCSNMSSCWAQPQRIHIGISNGICLDFQGLLHHD